MTEYNPWPLGNLPEHFRRPEIDQLKKTGYNIGDARDAVTIFENKIAEYAGSKYAVAVDSCTDALFLSLKYIKANDTITFPSRTYVSAPMAAVLAGCNIEFKDYEWSGLYRLDPYPVIDSAVRFTKDMYVKDTLQCLSFQIKKRVPIGRGGMILTDSKEAFKWFKYATYDGRNLRQYYMDDEFAMIGWHMYMTPEDAARGIILMDSVPEENEDTGSSKTYSDLSDRKVFKKHLGN